MLRRVIVVAATAVLGVAVNLATDNLSSVFAWTLVGIAIVLAALTADLGKVASGQYAKVRGGDNSVTQRGHRAVQRANVRGKANEVKQSDS